jgi:hypothetical protein
MPIVHVKKTLHSFARDNRLTWKARGLLAYLLSHDDDWQVNVQDLIRHSNEEGRTVVQTALKELLRLQYATLEPCRTARGTVTGTQYVIYDVPLDQQTDHPCGCGTEKQKTRLSEKPRSRKTESRQNRESENLSLGEDPYVVVEDHREAGLPTVGKTESRKTCLLTKDKDLRKDKEKERTLGLSDESPTVLAKEDTRPDEPYSAGFLTFWQMYPVKKQKDTAWGVWKKKHCEPEADTIAASIAIHQQHDTQWRAGYIPYPTTFLNGGGWKDELDAPIRRQRKVVL